MFELKETLIKPYVKAEIGVIGGSGIYNLQTLQNVQEIKVYTPYGLPSDNLIYGELHGRKVVFLPRHGRGHKIPPHKINYRANLWSLAALGVKWIISVSAVGSLREDYKPGDLVVPDQFIDMTKKREYTFFDGPVVAHVSMAYPFCNHLRKILYTSATNNNIKIHEKGTYICIEGPRFSTYAESKIWKEVFKADIIGMTLVPEVNLACELQLCYATLAMITDYDVWAEKPVTAQEVANVMRENVKKAQIIIDDAIKSIPEKPAEEECSCCQSHKSGII